MEAMGVILDKPTPWCAGMVVVPKKSGAIYICVDLKPLNECVQREVHPLPKVDETLAQLTGAKISSKLDANSELWQIPLTESSRLLTTFITPSGRYCFNKLPFGIASAPKHFQKRMSAILSGLNGVVWVSFLQWVKFCQDQHECHSHCSIGPRTSNLVFPNSHLSGLSVAPADSIHLSMAVISFVMFGLIFPKDHRIIYLVRTKAVHGDGESAREIHPKSRTAHTATLRASYQEKHVALGAQNQAFSQVKAELAQPTTLTLYDVRAATKISEDVSSYRLGAVLLQKSTPPGNQSHMLLGQ